MAYVWEVKSEPYDVSNRCLFPYTGQQATVKAAGGDALPTVDNHG